MIPSGQTDQTDRYLLGARELGSAIFDTPDNLDRNCCLL
jgi:hypothetical protein